MHVRPITERKMYRGVGDYLGVRLEGRERRKRKSRGRIQRPRGHESTKDGGIHIHTGV